MIDIDWSQVDRENADELFRPLPDTRILTVRLAQDFERKMFTFMLSAGISKVYVCTESDFHDNICHATTRFYDVRLLGTQYTEYDFNNLLEMSDEEFSALPPSPNTGLVKSWRDELRKDPLIVNAASAEANPMEWRDCEYDQEIYKKELL